MPTFRRGSKHSARDVNVVHEHYTVLLHHQARRVGGQVLTKHSAGGAQSWCHACSRGGAPFQTGVWCHGPVCGLSGFGDASAAM